MEDIHLIYKKLLGLEITKCAYLIKKVNEGIDELAPNSHVEAAAYLTNLVNQKMQKDQKEYDNPKASDDTIKVFINNIKRREQPTTNPDYAFLYDAK